MMGGPQDTEQAPGPAERARRRHRAAGRTAHEARRPIGPAATKNGARVCGGAEVDPGPGPARLASLGRKGIPRFGTPPPESRSRLIRRLTPTERAAPAS